VRGVRRLLRNTRKGVPSPPGRFHCRFDYVRPLELLYVANLINRCGEGVRQDLTFRLLVQRLAYEKTVEVHWAGEDGVWRVLPAQWVCGLGPQRELWEARASFSATADHDALPGDIRFALRCGMAGLEFWDNNYGANYDINADSGIRLGGEHRLLHVDYRPQLDPAQNYLPISVAVRPPDAISRVFVRWSADRWRTVHETPCYFKRRHWGGLVGSSARNPNCYGNAVWITHLDIGGAGHVEYAIGCETAAGVIWDNNFGCNYAACRDRFRVLTLNLHCNQEEDQDAKLTLVARAIRELEVDIVCLQEVAEPWNDGLGRAEANTALLIRDRIGCPYHLHQDWSHLGFGRYREGCAVLSRHPFLHVDSGYMSLSRDPFSIHARRVVLARVAMPYLGPVNVFSSHLSWLSDGFREQFSRLRQWANEQHNGDTAATLLCGDFNIPANSEGYAIATREGNFVDQFLRGRLRQRHEEGAGPPPVGNERPDPADGRIDYLFAHRDSRLEAVSVRELFTETDYGRVSDHPGYLVEFEPR
jgi:maltose 6'-phosphate phosphatase